MTPTQRTLTECKGRGWPAHVVEKWIAQARKRIDVWGFGDVLVLDGQLGSLLIQATVTDSMSSRVKKIGDECKDLAMAWLAAGNRIEVWGWAKRGAAGKRKLWTLRRVAITSDGRWIVAKEMPCDSPL